MDLVQDTDPRDLLRLLRFGGERRSENQNGHDRGDPQPHVGGPEQTIHCAH